MALAALLQKQLLAAPDTAASAPPVAPLATSADKHPQAASAAGEAANDAGDPDDAADPARHATTLAMLAAVFAPAPAMSTPPAAQAAPAASARSQTALLADRIAAAANAVSLDNPQRGQAAADHSAGAAPVQARAIAVGAAFAAAQQQSMNASAAAATPAPDPLHAMPVPPVMPADTPGAGAIASAAVAATAGAANQRSDGANRLLDLLGQRLQFQNSQGVQQALVRLEPYMAGSIRVEIRHDAGTLQIHLSASREDVVRQLQSAGESLRQELTNRQFTDVSVQVGQHRDDGRHGRQARDGQQQHAAPPPPGRALGADAGDTQYADISMALGRLADAHTVTR
ncbi:flagellar hook-length control protein FliK [Xanthomonas campestris pv. phormiicola]|nr:flagellar hook-length control protein FliK [Xanthomonas campestris pv. phormiicola]